MAKILIKKRVDLEFLGEEYKDSYLTFKSMPISSFQKLLDEIEGADNKKNLEITVKVLKDNFIEGKFQGEDVNKDDLDDFDIQTLVTCLERFTGQSQAPKV